MVQAEIIRYYGYPAERIDVVANGVPVAQFAPSDEKRAAARRSFGLAADDVALLFVGSGWERKGLATAIRAVEKLKQPRLKLLVAGRGKASRFRSASVQITGEISDVTPLYQASDIFVLPTLYDPFSNACLEAMASGLPVITTSSNGFAEAIDEGVQGSVTEAGDADALATTITFWLDAKRRAAAVPLILARAAQFDISRNVERTLAILLQAASAVSTSGKIRNT